jgi:hypothetical protein
VNHELGALDRSEELLTSTLRFQEVLHGRNKARGLPRHCGGVTPAPLVRPRPLGFLRRRHCSESVPHERDASVNVRNQEEFFRTRCQTYRT